MKQKPSFLRGDSVRIPKIGSGVVVRSSMGGAGIIGMAVRVRMQTGVLRGKSYWFEEGDLKR